MISKLMIDLVSVRLDRYYSGQGILDDLSENTRILIMARKNFWIKGPIAWKDMILRFMNDTVAYLWEYFKRSNSKEGFSADKRPRGHMIFQKRKDRLRGQDSGRDCCTTS
ncbi:hypothetical protein [Caldiplasma sukawensis]